MNSQRSFWCEMKHITRKWIVKGVRKHTLAHYPHFVWNPHPLVRKYSFMFPQINILLMTMQYAPRRLFPAYILLNVPFSRFTGRRSCCARVFNFYSVSISVFLWFGLSVMSSVGEGDQPAEEPKPVTKEKKPKVPKEKARQPKTVSHPPYFQMIKEALLALNEKGGSSPYAIAKYTEEKHKSVLPGNFRKMLALQLKNQAARGKLVKIKASYKLSSEAGKKGRDTAGKVTRSATQKTHRSKRSAPKKAETGKKARKAARKVVGVKKTKKSSTAAKPKQPKSLRSSSKRTRKVTASAS